MKSKYLVAAILAVFLLVVFAMLAVAQTEPPAPYAGLKNPFAWTDTQAQTAGKAVYQQSCAGCHGVGGSSLREFDFSLPAYSEKLEARPDFYFWILSEGRINRGMPGYKSSLSEEKRWQNLTYVWSLGKAPPQPPAAQPPARLAEGASLTVTVPRQADTGQEVTFTAILKDAQGKPISAAVVKFFLTENFFAQGLMEIGEAVTNEQGIATIKYIPRRAGDTSVTARYQAAETATEFRINEAGKTFYKTEVGMRFPSPGPEVFIGPPSAHELDSLGFAPQSALRLPGGLLSWLWLYIGVIILVWATYFVAMYQTLRIALVRADRTGNNSLLPLVALAVILGLGLLMVLMIITGPVSHFHLVD